MAATRLISLHPKLAAIFDAIFSLFCLWWISGLKDPILLIIWFISRVAWWALLVQIVYYPPYLNRYRHLISLAIFNLGMISFLVFSDPSTILISRLLTVALPLFSFWLIPERADSLSVMEKPHRRWKFFMALFGVAGIWLAPLAGITFQIISGLWVIASICLAAFLTAIISFWEWNEYGLPVSAAMFQLQAVLFLVLVELGALVFLWPIGYFVGSLLITWAWYLAWLLFRFHLSQGGIDWPKQRAFLLGNLIILIIFLVYVVRWT